MNQYPSLSILNFRGKTILCSWQAPANKGSYAKILNFMQPFVNSQSFSAYTWRKMCRCFEIHTVFKQKNRLSLKFPMKFRKYILSMSIYWSKHFWVEVEFYTYISWMIFLCLKKKGLLNRMYDMHVKFFFFVRVSTYYIQRISSKKL